MTVDTVFNADMRPVFVDEPSEVLRRLKARHPESWSRVCVGETNVVVSIPEYLHGDKVSQVRGMIRDVITKSQFAMYKRSPKRLEELIERTALKVIELVQKD